jgi:drug/metabolite transporter (DMT)-like permease
MATRDHTADGDEITPAPRTLTYALPAVGWFYLMRSHLLAMVEVFYSAGTILVLAGLGYVVFGERIGPSEFLGFGFAVAAVYMVSR